MNTTITKLGTGLGLLLLPVVTRAQGLADDATGGQFGDLLIDLLALTNTLLIPFILGIGFLVFVWGMFKFFIVGGANDDAKEQGKSLMVYATLGFVLIIVFWGVVNLVATSTGLDDDAASAGLGEINNVQIGGAE